MQSKKNHSAYLFILPMVLVLLTMVAYPFLANIGYSFLDYKLTQADKPFIFLDNYIRIFTEEDFLAIFGRTVVWTLGNMALILLLGISVGMLLDSNIKGKVLLQTVLLIPWVIPETVTGYVWKWMMASDYGILNRILMELGLIGPDFSWFRDGNMAMLAVILANVWRAFPFMAVMVYAKKRAMSPDWVEAAVIDGANSWQVFRHITLPYLKPVIARVATLVFIWSYNAFGIIYTMTNGGPLEATTIFPVYIQKKGFSNYDFGITAAMSVLMMITMLILLLGISAVPRWARRLVGIDDPKEEQA